MRAVRTKRVKTGNPAIYAGIVVTCMVLASCSSNHNAFFAKKDELIREGYTWQKLDRCRPAKEDALSIPVIGSDGQKIVCYVLVAPQNGIVLSTLTTTQTISPAIPTPATTTDTDSGTFGVIWDFSNF